eukprot:SAG31_NODE_6695_length_1922_cov_1.754800_3_plen_111_part_00
MVYYFGFDLVSDAQTFLFFATAFRIYVPQFAEAGDTIAIEYESMTCVVAMGKVAGEPMEFPLSNGLNAAILVPNGKSPGEKFEMMVPGLRIEPVTYVTKQRPKKASEDNE